MTVDTNFHTDYSGHFIHQKRRTGNISSSNQIHALEAVLEIKPAIIPTKSNILRFKLAFVLLHILEGYKYSMQLSKGKVQKKKIEKKTNKC